jgi:hypothetical protein
LTYIDQPGPIASALGDGATQSGRFDPFAPRCSSGRVSNPIEHRIQGGVIVHLHLTINLQPLGAPSKIRQQVAKTLNQVSLLAPQNA